MTLTPGDYGLIAAMWGVPVVLILFNLKALTRRVESTEDRLHALGKEKDEDVRRLERAKVDRVDFVRVEGSTRAKIDDAARRFDGLAAEVRSNMNLAPAITGLAREIGKLAEAKSNA